MTKIEPEVLEVLKKAELREDGKLVLSKDVLDRKLYVRIDKILNVNGYKWDRKLKMHYPIDEDSFEKLSVALETGVFSDDKKVFQFFPTPEKIVDAMLENIETFEGATVLEPSFGSGNILKAIINKKPKNIFGVELNSKMFTKTTSEVISKKTNIDLRCEDFLISKFDEKFDIILANPPFSKNQSSKHFLKMFDILKEGGKLVCILSKSDLYKENSCCIELKKVLSRNNSKVTDIPAGEFKESGTNIATVMVVLTKGGN